MSNHHEIHEKTVLPNDLGGGPQGLGDPDSTRLRKVETDVCIPRLMKEIAHEKCVDVVKVFEECGKNAGLKLPFKCRAENAAMKECLIKWYKDEKFQEEVKQQYLEERKQYRLTGEPVKRYWMGKRITEKSLEALPEDVQKLSDIYRKKHAHDHENYS